MKGLLVKEWLLGKRVGFAFACFILLCIGISFVREYSMFFTALYPALLAGLMEPCILQHEEKSQWDHYCDTLPCSRAQVVSSKYLTVLICVGVTVVLMNIAPTLRVLGLLPGQEMKPVVQMVMAGCSVVTGLLAPSVVLPFIFKFGAAKGMIAYYISIGIFIMGTGMLNNILHIAKYEALLSSGVFWAALVMAAAVVFAESWMLSVRFYKGREL